MKKWFLIILLSLAVLALLGLGYWLYQTHTIWKTYSFGLSGQKNIALIVYPDKYQNVSDNAALPDQKVGLFSIANVINFQLSHEAKDKNINTYISSVIASQGGEAISLDTDGSPRPTPRDDNNPNDTQSVDTNYKTAKYGSNKVYLINEFNKSSDFVVGDLFDGKGHRLNFSYHAKNIKAKEIKALITRIKF